MSEKPTAVENKIRTSYETVIGLEIHVQLATRSKMFCSCRADYQSAQPNTLVCPVCLGMPGVLPVINETAVKYTIMTGLALNCRISAYTKFDRKNYPYPDLMKGYQISQYDSPIAIGGYLEIGMEGSPKRVGITRVHLEEDVAKLQHVRNGEGSYSLVDVNRSGTPLMEIVSEPDMRSADEAKQYLTSVHSILQYLGVSTVQMQEGSFRCDANISVRPVGSDDFNSKVEVKNMNSFRAVHNALKYEVDRQIRIVEDGGRVAQETRGWIEERNVTVSQRSKEFAHDYRYFPEPDLPPLFIDSAWVDEIRASLPELPVERRNHFMTQFGLPLYDAGLLTNSKATADFFERCMEEQSLASQILADRAKTISNWVLTELNRLLNLTQTDITQSKVTPGYLVELVDLIDAGTLSNTLAKTVLEESFDSGKSPREVVAESGYEQIHDSSIVETAVDESIMSSPQAVSDYLKGKETAAKFLVGQVMRITNGQANPAVVNQMVREKLEAIKES